MTINEMNERKRELGYSYEQIAQLSGVPVGTVRKVLGGTTKAPRFATLQALEKLLNPEKGKAADREIFHDPATVRETALSYDVKKQGEYTLEDYLALPDERRVELIDGVIYDMSAPKGYHQLIAGELYSLLLAYIRSKKGKCLPFISPIDVQLDCDDRTVVQPDVIILCDTEKYTPDRIVGAPDFVAEVLSPATRSKDMILKLHKYQHAGVREYWIIDPDQKRVLTYLFGKGDAGRKPDEGENVIYGVYSFQDQVPVGIYDGDLLIDFSQIDEHVSPWM